LKNIILLYMQLGNTWWAPAESNRAPTNYAYHYNFRCLFPVCGLDYTLPLRLYRLVSTPSYF
jgi:hypothetical protein